MAFLMKGQKFRDRFTTVRKTGERVLRFQYPVIVEPKIDDIRCRVHAVRNVLGWCEGVQFLSYADKPLHNLDQFAYPFVDLFNNIQSINNIDCGVEVNGNFNDSYRWTRSSTGAPKELNPGMVHFHLFDLPDSKLLYEERRQILKGLADMLTTYRLKCSALGGVTAFSDEDVEAIYDQYRARGFEGAMLKTLNHAYQIGKRSWDWYKLKPEDDADGVIIDFTEAVATVETATHKIGDGLGRVGSVTVKCEDGSVASPSGIAHDLGRGMFENPGKYLDLWCEFRFMERDRQGGYRHPIFHRIREAKA